MKITAIIAALAQAASSVPSYQVHKLPTAAKAETLKAERAKLQAWYDATCQGDNYWRVANCSITAIHLDDIDAELVGAESFAETSDRIVREKAAAEALLQKHIAEKAQRDRARQLAAQQAKEAEERRQAAAPCESAYGSGKPDFCLRLSPKIAQRARQGSNGAAHTGIYELDVDSDPFTGTLSDYFMLTGNKAGVKCWFQTTDYVTINGETSDMSRDAGARIVDFSEAFGVRGISPKQTGVTTQALNIGCRRPSAAYNGSAVEIFLFK